MKLSLLRSILIERGLRKKSLIHEIDEPSSPSILFLSLVLPYLPPPVRREGSGSGTRSSVSTYLKCWSKSPGRERRGENVRPNSARRGKTRPDLLCSSDPLLDLERASYTTSEVSARALLTSLLVASDPRPPKESTSSPLPSTRHSLLPPRFVPSSFFPLPLYFPLLSQPS